MPQCDEWHTVKRDTEWLTAVCMRLGDTLVPAACPTPQCDQCHADWRVTGE